MRSPGLTRASSASASSARHSSRPWRIRRSSSLPASDHLARLHQPLGNHPGIGRAQVGEAAAQGRAVAHRARGADTGIALHAAGAQLIQLRRADVLVLDQQFAARQLRACQRCTGFGFAQRCIGLGQVAVQAAVVELQQQFALAHLLADIDIQCSDAKAADFNAQLHFFPRSDRPGHQHAALDLARCRGDHGDGHGTGGRVVGLPCSSLLQAAVATASITDRARAGSLRRMRGRLVKQAGAQSNLILYRPVQ